VRVRARRSSQPVTWLNAHMAQARLQPEHRDGAGVVTGLAEAGGFQGVWIGCAVQEGLHPCLLQGAMTALVGLPPFCRRAQGAGSISGGSSLGGLGGWTLPWVGGGGKRRAYARQRCCRDLFSR